MAFFRQGNFLTHAEKKAYFEPLISDEVALDDGRFDCVFDHPDYGPIEFTASDDDTEEHGRIIHEICVDRASLRDG